MNTIGINNIIEIITATVIVLLSISNIPIAFNAHTTSSKAINITTPFNVYLLDFSS